MAGAGVLVVPSARAQAVLARWWSATGTVRREAERQPRLRWVWYCEFEFLQNLTTDLSELN